MSFFFLICSEHSLCFCLCEYLARVCTLVKVPKNCSEKSRSVHQRGMGRSVYGNLSGRKIDRVIVTLRESVFRLVSWLSVHVFISIFRTFFVTKKIG